MTQTDILASVTKAADFDDDTGVDISGLSGDFTFFIELEAMSAASGVPSVVMHVQHVEAADFTTPRPGPTFEAKGTVDASAPKRYSFSQRDFPSLPVGDTNGKARIQLLEMGGSTPSVTAHAWIVTD